MQNTTTNQTVKSASAKKATKLFPYSGSKYKYKGQIQNMIAKMNLSAVDTYIEPFAGSLGSFFHILEKVNAKQIIINDINPKITNIYQQIKNDPEQVKKAFKALEEHFQALLPTSVKSGTVELEDRHLMVDAKQFYTWVRDYVNVAPLTPNHAAAMIFVLNHNFKGMYQESKKRRFNVSFNWSSRRINIARILHLIDDMHTFFVVKQVQIFTMDVFDLLAKYNNPETFIYLDPPYIDNTVTYVSDGFDISLPNQMKLIYTTLKYKYVMYSNHDNQFLKAFFDHSVNFQRSNKIAGSQKAATEIMAYRINSIPQSANNISKPKKAVKKPS